MRGVFLDRVSLDLGDLDLGALERTFAEFRTHPATAAEEVPARIAGFDVVISNKVVLGSEVLRGAGGLRHICVAATGTNNVDLQAAKQLGIAVSNCRGYGTSAVAQHTLALVLALSTRLIDYRDAVRRGEWNRADQFCLLDYPIRELAGQTLGIIGFGTLGQAVARLARAFGMHILVWARPGSRDTTTDRLSLSELLPKVDVLSIHCPLTDETRNLIGTAELQRMKPGSVLVNTARGGIVDEPALAEALRSGHLGGAATDVLLVEPPRQGNPLLDATLPNLIVTPHCAWGSREARQRLVDQLVENIQAHASGSELRRVV